MRTGTSVQTEAIDPDDPVSLNAVLVSQVYTVRQVATLLSVNLGMTYELLRQGKIPGKRLGKRWVIPRELFHTWLNTTSTEREVNRQ